MRQLKVWKFISEKLEKDQPVILMCVVESQGSSPGRAGFKMAVTQEELCGSVGGGIMEHKFVEMCRQKLAEHSQDPLLRKQLHQKSAAKNQSGMICSGEQTILIYSLKKNELPAINKIIGALEAGERCNLEISPGSFAFGESSDTEEAFHFSMHSESDFEYRETLGLFNDLYIIGGGHCALALSRLMSQMDFRIHVFEERTNLNTLEENNFAFEKKIVEGYSELGGLIPPGANHFIAVMTFGYRTDDVAVRSLAGKEFKYLGVLGSEAKMKQLFSEWNRDRIDNAWLNKIHAPIGLQIKSETPEEIAVSIAAEIIKIKNA